MKRLFKKAKAKFGVIVGAVALGANSAMADVDLTAVQTSLDAGSAQLEGYTPAILGFILVTVVITAI